MYDKTKQNENGAAVGEPCDVNDDCESGWCNLWAIPHACGSADNDSAAVGENVTPMTIVRVDGATFTLYPTYAELST